MDKIEASIDLGKNTTELLTKLGDNASILVSKLATQMGITVDKIFPYYTKHAFYASIAAVISGLIMVALGFWFCKFVYDRTGEGEEGKAIALTVLCICEVIGIVIYGCLLPGFISGIINPEYIAIHSIMSDLAEITKSVCK